MEGKNPKPKSNAKKNLYTNPFIRKIMPVMEYTIKHIIISWTIYRLIIWCIKPYMDTTLCIRTTSIMVCWIQWKTTTLCRFLQGLPTYDQKRAGLTAGDHHISERLRLIATSWGISDLHNITKEKNLARYYRVLFQWHSLKRFNPKHENPNISASPNLCTIWCCPLQLTTTGSKIL